MMKEAEIKMKLSNKVHKAIISALAVTLLSACSTTMIKADKNSVTSEISPNISFDLNQVSCWDAMTLESEERDYLLFLLYGYSSGVVAKNKQSGEGIKNALISVGTHCVDNPDDLLIDVFKNTLTN